MLAGAAIGVITVHQHRDLSIIQYLQHYLTGTQDEYRKGVFAVNAGAIAGGLAGLVVSLAALRAFKNGAGVRVPDDYEEEQKKLGLK